MHINLDLIPWHAVSWRSSDRIAVTLLLLFNERIAGISGIVGGLYGMQRGDISWRMAFILGLILSAVIWRFFFVLPAIHMGKGIYEMLQEHGWITCKIE